VSTYYSFANAIMGFTNNIERMGMIMSSLLAKHRNKRSSTPGTKAQIRFAEEEIAFLNDTGVFAGKSTSITQETYTALVKKVMAEGAVLAAQVKKVKPAIVICKGDDCYATSVARVTVFGDSTLHTWAVERYGPTFAGFFTDVLGIQEQGPGTDGIGRIPALDGLRARL
jgi:hypothetical protein